MPLDTIELLKIYFQHLQHTENNRIYFTQISVGIVSVVMMASTGLQLGEKILLGTIMLAFSYTGTRICNNFAVDINEYNSAIYTLIGKNPNPLKNIDQNIGDKVDGPTPIQENHFYFTDSYSKIFYLLSIVWCLYILTLFFYIFALFF